MHWASQYIGQQWRTDQDCLYWYRRWKREQFGRDVALCNIDHERLLRSAAKVMCGDVGSQFGYRLTNSPVEGDAAFLTQRSQPHHIGMVVVIDGRHQILHALEGVGVIVSTMADLAANGWQIREYWTDES